MGDPPFDSNCNDEEAACVEDMKQNCSGEDTTYTYGAWTQEQINCITVGSDEPTICACGTGTYTVSSLFCQ